VRTRRKENFRRVPETKHMGLASPDKIEIGSLHPRCSSSIRPPSPFGHSMAPALFVIGDGNTLNIGRAVRLLIHFSCHLSIYEGCGSKASFTRRKCCRSINKPCMVRGKEKNDKAWPRLPRLPPQRTPLPHPTRTMIMTWRNLQSRLETNRRSTQGSIPNQDQRSH
jgi:hypothetical protein